ncbi:DUF5366 family protein [Paenisporosarcina cavernae]|uniref:YufK family protein n=1 Tax=Paenisporosarcina cavernae TaxID=2320858 RepID=A0A385YVM7_9BACL|nr:DUF5366 family protein [Paenisporosarcina cavernae]AYC29947.1 hypothetical protein D3873_08690 [Paenisporosarcina cavernae]
MKNPYIFGYLPLITIVLFSLTFGVYAVGEAMTLFQGIGVYAGMREFLTHLQLQLFLLIVFALFFFMVFSALKLIAETIHELAMLFFSKDIKGETIHQARGGYVIFFFGSLLSVIGIQSIQLLALVFLGTAFIYFVYVVYKLSHTLTFGGTLGLILFEILTWSIFVSMILYVFFKLYNGIIASLPFLDQ